MPSREDILWMIVAFLCSIFTVALGAFLAFMGV